MEPDFPPGYRFLPTDWELIDYYLTRKEAGAPIPPYTVLDADVYQFSPSDLFETYNLSTDQEWYFFSSRNKKYPNGARPDRAAGDGIWKATGSESSIEDDKGVTVGTKRSLVYIAGKCEKTKTDWLMREYALGDPEARPDKRMKTCNSKLDGWVLSKIYHKNPSGMELEIRDQSDQSTKQFANANLLPMHHASHKNPCNGEVPGDHMMDKGNRLCQEAYSAPKRVVSQDLQPNIDCRNEFFQDLDVMTEDEVNRFFLGASSPSKRVVRQDPHSSNSGYTNFFPDIGATMSFHQFPSTTYGDNSLPDDNIYNIGQEIDDFANQLIGGRSI